MGGDQPAEACAGSAALPRSRTERDDVAGDAENATLAFMVGASDEDFAAALPLLEAMGKRIVHCGGPGLGQAARCATT
ncbi:hypothetical protein DC31_06555 [Microbacterium sp. CH12i]|nr:hypothetical protein DC31_06555 [Microbacterium sp. CH12i]